MATKLYTAILFFPGHMNRKPRKYKNCNPIRFNRYALKQGGEYVNYYDPETGIYSHRFYTNTVHNESR